MSMSRVIGPTKQQVDWVSAERTRRHTLHQLLDTLTDEAIPAVEAAIAPLVEMTIEDKEALSDWLQDRFYNRIADKLDA